MMLLLFKTRTCLEDVEETGVLLQGGGHEMGKNVGHFFLVASVTIHLVVGQSPPQKKKEKEKEKKKHDERGDTERRKEGRGRTKGAVCPGKSRPCPPERGLPG